MILYQLAKWMEEHRRLQKIIRSTDGEIGLLVRQKEQVERLMIAQAQQWLGQGGVEKELASKVESENAAIVEAEVSALDWIEPVYASVSDVFELSTR